MNLKEYSEEYIKRVRETSKLDPIITLSILSRDWLLLFNNRAIMDFQQDTGINLLLQEVAPEQWGDPVILLKLLYRGLQYRHPEITEDLINTDILIARYYIYIITQLRTAISSFRPDMTGVVLDGEVEATDDDDPTVSPTDVGSPTGVKVVPAD